MKKKAKTKRPDYRYDLCKCGRRKVKTSKKCKECVRENKHGRVYQKVKGYKPRTKKK
jgi:hypothetical protein